MPKTSYPPHLTHLSCTFCPKFPNLTTIDPLSLLVVVPPNSSPVFLIVSWHPWLRTYHPISRIPNKLSKFFRTFSFMALTSSFSLDGLSALKFFLDKCPNQEPFTAVLVWLAELLLTLNNFSFDGEHYQQISGVAMGTKMVPTMLICLLALWKNKSSNNILIPSLITLAGTQILFLGG